MSNYNNSRIVYLWVEKKLALLNRKITKNYTFYDKKIQLKLRNYLFGKVL